MLSVFERLAKKYPLDTFLIYIDKDGKRQEYTYEDIRFHAVALAMLLEKKRVGRNSCVSVDMSNSPAFVISALAAAYGGFTLAILNHRLTEEEKSERLGDLQMVNGIPIATHLTEQKVTEMLGSMDLFKVEPENRGWQLFKKKPKKAQASGVLNDVQASTDRELIHFAEKSTAVFDSSTLALFMFTSGTTGRPKAVPLTWGNLTGAAKASNRKLNTVGKGLWQGVLPLYHIGGFEVLVRSVLNETPFALYRRFHPVQVLSDAERLGATHISVVDKMLQDLMKVDTAQALPLYQCILLGGAALNPVTVTEAVARAASVYASYGMTETSSQVASKLVDADFDGSLEMLSGYQAQIITPDENGYGLLAVKGPGVFSSYVNSKPPFTVDGFFLTGDVACMVEGRIKIQERVGDMFVSGGENIYPAEIEEKIKRIPGVSDAYVFGVEDADWGRRPIAFVERSKEVSSFARASTMDAIMANRLEEENDMHRARAQGSPQMFASELMESFEQRLSKLYVPKQICVMDEFPRSAVGKVDKSKLRVLYDERIDIEEVTLYHVRQKLTKPFVTAKVNMKKRESIIVEVKDSKGRTGLGECVAFSSDWYLPETLADDFKILEDHLIPLVLSQVYLHPSEAIICFDECAEAKHLPLAKGALEPALWDLYGKISKKPFWQLIGGESPVKSAGASLSEGEISNDFFDVSISSDEVSNNNPETLLSNGGIPVDGQTNETRKHVSFSPSEVQVPGGLVVGIMSIPKTLEAVEKGVEEGYTRFKLKIRPGDDLERVKAVRMAYPKLMIILDANQSYTEDNLASLKELDALDIRCIEEPLNPEKKPRVGPDGFFARIARLQKELQTPICLDESISSPEDAWEALQAQAASCYALKIGKWGGVQNALEFYQAAHEQGAEVWMGGMFETAISKRLHAAFETLPGIDIPGDLSSTSSYFKTEISRPPFEVVGGMITLNEKNYETGIGCTLNLEELKKISVGTRRYHL